MTLSETKKLAKHICRLLKVPDITMPIGRTGKGNIGLVFNENNDEYDIMLDSVPLSTKNELQDENNIELKKMLEKYLFSPEGSAQMQVARATEFIPNGTLVKEVSHAKPAKKVGRPKGTTKTK